MSQCKATVQTRRFFLKRATALSALVAAPTIIPASARGANGQTAPSERITLGHIGMGKQNSGALLGGFLNQPDTQVLAVCDVESKRLKTAQKRANDHYAAQTEKGEYKGCIDYHNYEDLLAREELDAVVIATPDHWHAIMAIHACRAGKDVYCEKPLSLTVRQARAMVNAARRYGRVFQTGSMQRSDSKFRIGCEMVRNEWIGKVQTVNVNVGGPSEECYLPEEPRIPTLDWDRWLGPAPWRPYHSILCPDHTNTFPNWRQYRDYSGGGMTDWGAHHFDIMQWGLGMDHSGPVEIIPPNGSDVPRLTYRYANGVTVNHGGATGGAGAEFHGPDGSVRVNRGFLDTTPPELMRRALTPGEIRLYASNNHYADFLKCIRTRQKPICDVEIGARSVTVCHLGNIAYWLGRPLKWDPVKEEIIGDPEAARWLDRPSRAPYVL